jgi:hypothetical protein
VTRKLLSTLDLATTPAAKRFCREALALDRRLFRLWHHLRDDPGVRGAPLTRAELITKVLPSESNPTGKVQASSLVFPCDDGSVNTCVAASVFRHLLERDAIHYLQEIARVLALEGTAIVSIHNAVPAGERFVGNETRIDIATHYFLQLSGSAGLAETERVDDLGGQQVFILRKNSST